MIRLDLSDGWKLISEREVTDCHPSAAEQTSDWIPLEGIETVQSALTRSGRITKPWLNDNFKAFEEFEEDTWWYRLEFEVPFEARRSDGFELRFDGISIFATIWLNGTPIGFTNNAHHAHLFDVTDSISRDGRNILSVECSLGLPWLRRNVRSDVSASGDDVKSYARAPHMMFGWDFAPRVPVAGLYRHVILFCHRGASISDLNVRTIRANESSAELEISVDVKSVDGSCPVFQYTVEDGEAEVLEGESLVSRGFNRIALRISSPRLWYPRPAGEPFLYDLKTRLLEDGEEVDKSDIRFGIRTVELKQDNEFTIAVNGRRIFARGANWVPPESLSLVATPEKYDYLLSLARDAEFNMLRVWGGGIYEPEAFYDLCDRFGIMVWQDFMYACSMYPDDDPVFMGNAEREAREVVKRLRRHPSVVLWCGNNECQEAWVLGDWPKRAPRHLGERLYDHVLPRIVRLLDPGVPYWPGSPYGGPTTRSLEIGDYHDWYSLPSWRTYDENAPRFSSEYGFRSVPQMETVEEMISPGLDWNPESQHELWRSKGGGDGWTRSVLPEFGRPETLEDYIMLTQELQATLMRYAVEVYRRRMFETSGSLIWQFDEPWPGATFSLIDYFGRPKAAYYWTRKACSPVLGMFYESKGRTSFWAVNDLSEKIDYEATLRRFDHSGNKLGEKRLSGSLPSNESTMLIEEFQDNMTIGEPAEEFLHSRLVAGDFVSERFYHEGHRRDWILPRTQILAERVENETGLELALVSREYAHFVSLTVKDPVARFSDNYFDLLPREEKRVRVKTGKRGELVLRAANSDRQVLSPR